MAMIIELHMLQNFAPSCLNRDDTNSPKECEFGGYRRARISSQCIKRSIREYFKSSSLLPPENLASRTQRLVDDLAQRLVKQGKPEEQARQVIRKVIQGINLRLDDKDKTQYLIFIGEKEMEQMAELIIQQWDSLMISAGDEAKDKKKKKEESLKSFSDILTGGKAADLALFGRMLADLPNKNIDAACQVAHAISTHKVGVEFDFYTAIDDLKKPEEEPGAGMMGTVEFNSACFYRYANIDCAQLKKNLDGDKELTRKTIEAFIRAAVNATPTGKQNSFAAQNPPSFVFAVARTSGAWSLANAFASPVWVGDNGDLVQKSTDVLLDYWGKLVKVYNDKDIKVKTAFALDSLEMKGLNDAANLEGLIDRVNQAIAADC
ncbi:MAG: type I-E CRISPR-associated protein Cas7/Cse4/CasC [Chloroflexi bacterium RBG_16_50_9]|nr:MAG: type I-E CRISPR-associated protein Cas7/Cse4/CasC [Chloroflexi bacterium RBG_16_50_9]